MESKFVKLTGLQGQQLTINIDYLINFEPNGTGTKIYLDHQNATTTYPVTMSYDSFNLLLKSR